VSQKTEVGFSGTNTRDPLSAQHSQHGFSGTGPAIVELPLSRARYSGFQEPNYRVFKNHIRVNGNKNAGFQELNYRVFRNLPIGFLGTNVVTKPNKHKAISSSAPGVTAIVCLTHN